MGRVLRYSALQQAWELELEGVKLLLGVWWMKAAVVGLVNSIPIINIDHREENNEEN